MGPEDSHSPAFEWQNTPVGQGQRRKGQRVTTNLAEQKPPPQGRGRPIPCRARPGWSQAPQGHAAELNCQEKPAERECHTQEGGLLSSADGQPGLNGKSTAPACTSGTPTCRALYLAPCMLHRCVTLVQPPFSQHISSPTPPRTPPDRKTYRCPAKAPDIAILERTLQGD